MNNQVKLIDAPKFRMRVHKFKCTNCDLILLLEAFDEYTGLPHNCIHCSGKMSYMDDIIVVQESDTPPVPTIKPGDKVKYHDFQFPNIRAAVVDHLRVHSFGSYAVLRYDGELYTVPLSNVEVVE